VLMNSWDVSGGFGAPQSVISLSHIYPTPIVYFKKPLQPSLTSRLSPCIDGGDVKRHGAALLKLV
jgi:hypothetical protein